MRQFITGSDAAFADLERRARRSSIRFNNVEMPPGTTPSHSHVAFRINAESNEASIYVTPGFVYTGHSVEARTWLQFGEKRFPSFTELVHWLRNELADAYGVASPAHGPTPRAPGAQRPLSPDELTDIEAVARNLPDTSGPLYLNEEAIFQQLRSFVIGQDNALELLTRRLSRHVARRDPQYPATFFEIGPTGVGKTRTVEKLPEVLCTLMPREAAYNYLRLDMSEYQERYRLSQLLGSPQGYIGYDEGAQLPQALAANPKTIVLFDEIEKAHPHVLRALMNAMDAGRLSSAAPTSGGNRLIDCRRAIFFFTTNLDSHGIIEEVAIREALDNHTVVEEICRAHLSAAGVPPELIGRIGTFLLFQPLSLESRAKILALTIVEVARQYGVEVTYIQPEVISHLLAGAQGSRFGVRPDRQLVDDNLGSAFSTVAAANVREPVAVVGPPYLCVPAEEWGRFSTSLVSPADQNRQVRRIAQRR